MSILNTDVAAMTAHKQVARMTLELCCQKKLDDGINVNKVVTFKKEFATTISDLNNVTVY